MNRRFFCLLGLSALLLPAFAFSQPRGRLPPNLQTPDQLDPAMGDEVLERFRSVGPAGDLILGFRLTHRPYRGETVSYAGRLAGSWATGAPRTRVELPGTDARPAFRMLQWNGPEPRFWRTEGADAEPVVRQLSTEELFEPVVADVTFSPFELQMPFVYWKDYAYEGTRRVKGRPAHYFLLYPPADAPRYQHLGGVRAVIDADFNVILRAEILDPDGKVLKALNVQSFKKVDGQWIVRRIDLSDEATRDRTRFEVEAAAVGLSLEPGLFEPEALRQPLPNDTLLEAL